MSDIKIFKENESTILVQAQQKILREFHSFFSIYTPNYRFSPKFKAKLWDGKIKFFNARENSLSIGLLNKAYEFAELGNYSIETMFADRNDIDFNEFKRFVGSIGLPKDFEVRDYQLQAAYEACTEKKLNVHISTSGGKSLVIYIICRFLERQKLKTLIIVPNQDLVTQLYKDFEDYGWNVDYKCHKLVSGKEKVFDRPVIISCWQSLYRNLEVHKLWDCIICDECHGARGESIQKIAKGSVNASYRIGFSGTYPDKSTADWYSIVGAFGPIKTFATYQTLQQQGHIAKIKIYDIMLNYNIKTKLDYYFKANKDYNEESNLIYANDVRNRFILKMCQNVTGNTLVLFTKKEAHGYKIREILERELTNKTLLYIDGDVKVDDREDIRQLIGTRNDIILLATYSTIGAGWSAKNIHNIIFASGSKSKIRTLQAIGRGLRLNENKEHLKLFDIVDNLSFNYKEKKIRYINHFMKHYKERCKFYEELKWPHKEVKYTIE